MISLIIITLMVHHMGGVSTVSLQWHIRRVPILAYSEDIETNYNRYLKKSTSKKSN